MAVELADIQTLAGGKDGIVDALTRVGLAAQRAARTARKLDLRETFGDDDALAAQIEAALPGLAQLEDQRAELVALLGSLQAGLAAIEAPLARVAAEYEPEEEPAE